MNSTKQQNKFTRFLRTHAALLIIIFCMLAITAVVLAVTLTRSPDDTVIPNDPVVGDPGNDDPKQDDDDPTIKPTPTTEKVYFRKPVEYTYIDLEYTSCEGDDLFVFNRTLGYWATHRAVDLAAADGAPVSAMYDGLVVEVGETIMKGNYVKIDHGDGVVATYASLSDVQVIEGQKVKQGEKIGAVSTSMGAECENGAHLHLEVYKDGEVTDPMPYVNGEIFREVTVD